MQTLVNLIILKLDKISESEMAKKCRGISEMRPPLPFDACWRDEVYFLAGCGIRLIFWRDTG